MNELVLQAFERSKFSHVDAWIKDYPAILDHVRFQIRTFPAFALPSIDAPAVFCGVAHQHGVGEAWMLSVEGFEQHLATVRRQQRQAMKTIYTCLGLHRMHMMTEVNFRAAYEYAESLGFSYETTLRRYGPRGEDVDVHLWPEGNGNA